MKGNKHTVKKAGYTTASAVGVGIGLALAVTVLLSALLTNLTASGRISEGATDVYVFIIRVLAALAGSLVGAGLAGGKYLATIGIVLTGYTALLLGLGIVLYDGSFQNFGLGVLSVLCGGIVACLIKLMTAGKRKNAVRYNR